MAQNISEITRRSRIASIDQAVLTNDQKNSILASISEALQTHKETILQPIKRLG